MQQIVLIFHVLISISIIVLVLLQHGKGADAGAAFGSGASQTMFGSQGTTSFLFKLTVVLGTLFFATSLTLGYLATQQVKRDTGLYPNQLPARTAPAPAPATKVPGIQAPATKTAPAKTTNTKK